MGRTIAVSAQACHPGTLPTYELVRGGRSMLLRIPAKGQIRCGFFVHSCKCRDTIILVSLHQKAFGVVVNLATLSELYALDRWVLGSWELVQAS